MKKVQPTFNLVDCTLILLTVCNLYFKYSFEIALRAMSLSV